MIAWMRGCLVFLFLACGGQATPPPLPPAEQRGPAIGKPMPAFEIPDQDGRPQTFQSLKGPKGLLLVLVQSADW